MYLLFIAILIKKFWMPRSLILIYSNLFLATCVYLTTVQLHLSIIIYVTNTKLKALFPLHRVLYFWLHSIRWLYINLIKTLFLTLNTNAHKKEYMCVCVSVYSIVLIIKLVYSHVKMWLAYLLSDHFEIISFSYFD